MKHIIYLHGFLSSPKSAKATETLDYFTKYHPEVPLHIPTLSGKPSSAVKVVEQVIHGIVSSNDTDKDTPFNDLRFVGSSMGGYLSTYFVETFGGKAVLINPAVEPFKLLSEYFGEHINPYTNELFDVDQGSVEQLIELNRPVLANDPKYLVYLQTGDETLDYRLAKAKYGVERCVIEDGGNHSFVGFRNHLRSIADFLLS